MRTQLHRPEFHDVGRYRVLRSIGAGAFATVWLAQDDKLGVPVAIKLLSENWTQQKDVRERFLREAQILRQVEDPHVVRVYDIGEHQGRPYFVMDFADQGSLADRMKAGPIRIDQAIDWSLQTARALSVLHRFGVVHRDVSPRNLLLRSPANGQQILRLMIADLGMAKALAEASGITMTVGTPAYMAPEQASHTGAFDGRADVYALGAVTYHLLAGRPPYNFDSPMALVNRPAGMHPRPIHLDRPDVPPEIDDILARALAYNPEQRWKSAEAYADALLMMTSSSPTQGGAPPPSPHTGWTLPSPGAVPHPDFYDDDDDFEDSAYDPVDWSRALPLIGLALAALVLFGIAFLVAWLLSR